MKKIERLLKNESDAWELVQEIRTKVEHNYSHLLSNCMSKEERDSIIRPGISTPGHRIIARGVKITQRVLEYFSEIYNFDAAEPAHSTGHLTRDYVNALRLLSDVAEECSSENIQEVLIGFPASALHDIGCAVIPRYDEENRAVRHAEVSGLITYLALEGQDDIANESLRLLISYAIMAHTGYKEDYKVACSDEITRKITPYVIYNDDATPRHAFHYPRWVDRLDANGPNFIGRHFLTLVEEHRDFTETDDGNRKFYTMKFAEQMVPHTREIAGHPTMLSHMLMYLRSQDNNSPYGKDDNKAMQSMRDAYSRRCWRIINALQSHEFPSINLRETISMWHAFLTENVEPSKNGVCSANALMTEFKKLESEFQLNWGNAFLQTLTEYSAWADAMLNFLRYMPAGYQALPGITPDVRILITPGSWKNLIIY